MRVLVLGGTGWLGHEVARRAVATGHAVTCLARGTSGRVPAGADWVRADRDEPGAYDAVATRAWDLVVDVTRQPGQVRSAVAALAGQAARWVFVSTVSVYADESAYGADESATLLPALPGDVMEDMSTYGEAKVACERLAVEGLGAGRVLLARAGLIGGPGDVSDRSGYWPLRFAAPAAEDGSVLVPDEAEEPVQLVDVRDLAAWLLDAGGRGVTGTYDVVGERHTLAEHLRVARAVAGHRQPLRRASSAWLVEQRVQPWTGLRSLPLWLPDRDWWGAGARDGSRARAAGLRHRPLVGTLADTLAWERTLPAGRDRRAGLTAEEERGLLADLARVQG